MNQWTCRRENEVMKRNSTYHNDDGGGDRGGGEEDEDVGGNDTVGGRVTSARDSLTAADNITFTQPVTLAIATPPVNTQPAVVTLPVDGQGTVYVTSSLPSILADRAIKFNSVLFIQRQITTNVISSYLNNIVQFKPIGIQFIVIIIQ